MRVKNFFSLKGLVNVVEENESLKNLNVESNFLSGELLAQLIRATLKNQTLVELHAENQVRKRIFSKFETVEKRFLARFFVVALNFA